MSAGIVRVNHVGAPGAHQLPDPPRGAEIPIGSHRHCGHRDAARPQPLQQRRVWNTDDERLVPPRTQTLGEQPDLPLSAAPIAARVDVKDPQGHRGKMDARDA